LAEQYGLAALQGQGPDSETMVAYLNTVGARVAAHVHRTGIRYHFYLQNDANFVNAFALPGGHIVVGRGLLRLMQSEDELAAVLGHEIAHVDSRNAIERVQYLMVSRKVGLDGLYQLGAPLIEIYEAGYTKEREFEADRAGLGLAVAADYSPSGGVNLMARFEKLEQNDSEHPLSGSVLVAQMPLSALEEYFRSHPPATERRVHMEREIRVNGWSTAKAMTPLAIRPQLGSLKMN
jgi:predicted Zn-dependent protease